MQKRNQGYTFAIDGKAVSNHDTIKFNWKYGTEDEPEKITGTDIITLKNGLVKMIYVFLDEL